MSNTVLSHLSTKIVLCRKEVSFSAILPSWLHGEVCDGFSPALLVLWWRRSTIRFLGDMYDDVPDCMRLSVWDCGEYSRLKTMYEPCMYLLTSML